METLGKESPSYITVQKWAAEFKRRRWSLKDDGHTCHSKDARAGGNSKAVQTLVMCDRRQDSEAQRRNGHKF